MHASAEAAVTPGYGDGPEDWFGTASLRRRVLDAWAASPTRFREDANAEEDAALGAYRDRLVVELLQNAVDAATAVGAPSRVLLRLRTDTGVLEVANNGAPLDAAGVEALSTLRASAKRDTGSVGKFGAGFAAVLAVSDEPSIASAQPESGAGGYREVRGVRWSKADTATAVHDVGAAGLHAELARRAGAVPVLRLPLPSVDPVAPPDGFDTVVRLPLRDAAAVEFAREQLAELDPTLPLVLPGLAEIVVDVDGQVRTLSCAWEQTDDSSPSTRAAQLDGRRWVGVTRQGSIPAELLADRPVEERGRSSFTARAMVREGGWPAGVAQVVRAPQPTDEPISLPVLVSVELPLEPSRRHTVAGPLRDWLVDRLADAVAELAGHLGQSDDPLAALSLVPTGLPAGEVDGRLRDQLSRLLPEARLFPGGRRGRECAVLDLGSATDGVTTLFVPVEVTRRIGDPGGPGGPGGTAERGDVADPGGAAVLGGGAVLSSGAAVMSGDLLAAEDDLPWFHPGLAAGASATAGEAADRGEEPEPVIDGLLPAAYAARRWRPVLAALAVRRLDTAAVVAALAGIRRRPAWWAELYTVTVSSPDRDALGALPVPLAASAPDVEELAPDQLSPDQLSPNDLSTDDLAPEATDPARALATRLVTGPRGVLLPTDDLDVAALVAAGLALRVVHPDACAGGARDALRTLGAVEGNPIGVLRDPAVHEAVAESDPDDDPASLLALATAVLALVRDSGATTDLGSRVGNRDGDGDGENTEWLADLLLPDTDGGFSPAGELLVAGGPLDQVVSADAPFGTLDPAFSDTWGVEVLEAVGVSRTFGVLRASMVTLDPDEPVLLDLDDSDRWVDDVADELARTARRPARHGPAAPPVLADFVAVRDLELVDRHAWPAAFAELAKPPLREVVLGSDPSYTRWWLSRNALLPVAGTDGSLPPTELTLPGADPLLAGLFSPAAPLPGVDDELLRRLGARYTLDDVLGDLHGVLDLLDRLGDDDRDVDWRAARALYVAAVTAAGAVTAVSGETLDPPLTVRTPDGVVDAAHAVIVDAPDLLALLGTDLSPLRVPLDRAAEVGAVLGVPLASSLSDYPLVSEPTSAGVAPDGTPYRVHASLSVADADGWPTEVAWRVVGGIGGDVHVGEAHVGEQDGNQVNPDALARALAWRAGVWHRRHALAAALRDPAGTAQRDAEDDLDDL